MQYPIIIVQFPYIEKNEFKVRPAVQISDVLDHYGNLQVAYITSTIPKELNTNEILVDITSEESTQSGLFKTSLIKTSKIYTITEDEIKGKVGKLSINQSKELLNILQNQFIITNT
jgi:mRNA-degrading endonuclease toxin of MazEF toxin-antitoxin module